MFRKLFGKKSVNPAAKQEASLAATPSVPEEPKDFQGVREDIEYAEAAVEALVRERANGGNENREWNHLIDWQNALIEALSEHHYDVFLSTKVDGGAVLGSVFRFLWSAHDWCEHWEQGLDDLIYGDLARTANYLEIALNHYGDFKVVDALKCEIGVKLSDLNDAEKKRAERALSSVLVAYMTLSHHPQYVDPLIGQYWGWVNGHNPGGWRFRVNFVQQGRETYMFLLENRETGPRVVAQYVGELLERFFRT